jgi:5-methylthioadenosine/S-adenosylhomocysteine deaminase
MSSVLVRARYVICGVDAATGKADVVEDGAVLVEDGVIAAVGPAEEMQSTGATDKVLGGSDYVAFPGFVNAHHHVGLTPFQLGNPDLPLELWITRRISSRRVDRYLDSLYSAFEMVRSGVTTVHHIQGRVYGHARALAEAADSVLRAYRDIGMRVAYSFMIYDQNRLVYEPDDVFQGRLPAELAGGLKPMLSAQTIPLPEYFELFDSLRQAFEREAKIAIQLAPANLHWCSDDALERIGAVAARHRVPMHMHLLETPYQKAYARRRRGGSAVRHLRELGLLGPLMTLGHATWVTEADLEDIAGSGASICHNCSSNMRLKSGTAPVNAMVARGIRVAIGIDEAGINDDRDMLQELRLVLCLHRVTGMEESAPAPGDVFRMATENGAHTTSFGERIGAIRPGRAADIVLARWAQLAYPYLDPEVPIVDALIHRAKSAGVDTVLIGGEAVLEGGRFTRVDEADVLATLARSLATGPSDEERSFRETAERLLPHVRAFYRGYLDDFEVDPYYRRQHSRR